MFLPLRDALPTVRFPVITVLLIVANVLVYIAGLAPSTVLGGEGGGLVSRHQIWVLEYGMVPCEVLGQCLNQGPVDAHSPALTLVTSMFVHGGLLHLAFNLLFLWVFGNNVEDAMHPLGFLAFYVFGGVAASVGQALVASGSEIPTVGASGAIAAVIGGYLLLYPRARIQTMVLLPFIWIWIPAWLVAGVWGAMQFFATWQSVFSAEMLDGGVAYMAHATGFAVGLLAVRMLAEGRNPRYEELYGAAAR